MLIQNVTKLRKLSVKTDETSSATKLLESFNFLRFSTKSRRFSFLFFVTSFRQI